MKIFLLSALVALGFASVLDGTKQSKIDLGYPLLTIQAKNGFIACAYIDTKTCDKTKEACAIVSGVKTHQDMLSRPLKAVSKKAFELGLRVGMSGEEALKLLKK